LRASAHNLVELLVSVLVRAVREKQTLVDQNKKKALFTNTGDGVPENMII
jgi:hypothetical protein